MSEKDFALIKALTKVEKAFISSNRELILPLPNENHELLARRILSENGLKLSGYCACDDLVFNHSYAKYANYGKYHHYIMVRKYLERSFLNFIYEIAWNLKLSVKEL